MSDPASMTVAQLKKELTALSLPTDGLKAVLVKRLTEAQKTNKRKPEKDDEDEEEDAKPAKKAKKNESDDEEEKPAKRGRGKKAAAKPKDDDESEEEKKPAKKGKKAAAKGKKAAKKEEVESEEEKDDKDNKKDDKKDEKDDGKDDEKDDEKDDKKGKGKEKSAEEKKEDREQTKAIVHEANKISPEDWKWKDTLMYFETPGVTSSEKLACFDYDGCLAATSLFKHGPDAWSVRHSSIPGRLKELHNKGYKLVIMTNQSDIGKAKPENKPGKCAEKISRLLGFANAVGLPFQILVATAKNGGSDAYRKPATGMWTFASENNGGIKPIKEKCFFVGDAAGRGAKKGKAKDHSDADKAFAKGAGLTFFTEDEFFENAAAYDA